MNPQRWDEVLALFDRAREMEPTKRNAFVRQASGEDRELEAEVCSLLHADDSADRFLVEPLFHLLADEAETVQPSGGEVASSRRLGAYLLEKPLGKGGMGAVWLASRADGSYQGEVAIKLLRRDIDTSNLVARFESERQILAGLRHPHIARLLDGGATEEGRPYLVMEHVDGVPIDHYCQAHRLAIRDRLEIFRKVCGAVQFAHQNLVVHRDLKASNILVDQDGEPKLLDFGVAKLLAPQGLVGPGGMSGIGMTGRGMTGTGMAPMTLSAASPEQLRNRPVTTATDVYSLGLLLFRLLTGKAAFLLEGQSAEEIISIICEQEPPAPSAVLDQSSPIRRQLSGDLDTIVLKALRKEPARRFASAQALADDLERYQRGLPVRSRPDTFGYRWGKFIRRHRWAVTAAATALAGLILFTALLLVQQRRVEREQRRTDDLNRFLQGILYSADPQVAQGREVTVRELLDEAALRVGSDFANQPDLRASGMLTIGKVYLSLGEFEKAEPLLEQARQLLAPLAWVGQRLRMEVVRALAEQKLLAGEYGRSEELYRQSVAAFSAGREREQLERSLAGLSQALARQGRHEEAVALSSQALALARDVYGANDRRVAEDLGELAGLQFRQGAFAEAADSYQQALDLAITVHGETHPTVANLYNGLALATKSLGDASAAEAALRQALLLQQRLYEDSHPSLATTRHNLAALLADGARLEEAETLARLALAARREGYVEGHPKVGETLDLLGLIRRRRGDVQGAYQLHAEALTVLVPALGEEHEFVAVARHNQAQAAIDLELLDQGEELLRQARAGFRAAYGDDHPQLVVVLNSLAILLKKQGKLASAEEVYREVLELQERKLGAEHPRTAGVQHNLAVLLQSTGAAREAEELLRQALPVFERTLGASHRSVGVCWKSLAQVLRDQERFEEAEAALVQALPILQQGYPEAHRARLSALILEAEILHGLGRSDEARELLNETLHVARTHGKSK